MKFDVVRNNCSNVQNDIKIVSTLKDLFLNYEKMEQGISVIRDFIKLMQLSNRRKMEPFKIPF